MSEDKEEKKEDETSSSAAPAAPVAKKLARITSGDTTEDEQAIYDTTQIKTLAFTKQNPVAQAVADMLGKTEDPDIRNTIKKAATDVMKPELGSPKELDKKLKQEESEKSDEKKD